MFFDFIQIGPQIFFLQFSFRIIIFELIVRQLIKNDQFRTRHCTHTNATISTEIGKRKISYAAREESWFYLGWGSKFRTKKCRTANISEFKKNNESFSNLFFHFIELFNTQILNNFSNCKTIIFQIVKLNFFSNFPNFIIFFLIFQIVKFWKFINFSNPTISNIWLFSKSVNYSNLGNRIILQIRILTNFQNLTTKKINKFF